jgi:hypothetical protein
MAAPGAGATGKKHRQIFFERGAGIKLGSSLYNSSMKKVKSLKTYFYPRVPR